MSDNPKARKIGAVTQITLEELFKGLYIVANLQRNYEWEKQELEKFWNDCENIDKGDGYFFGQMVFVKEKNTSRIKIIDGQQRLLTTSILIASIRDFVKKHTKDNYDINRINWLNLRLFEKVGSDGKTNGPKITLSEANRQYFTADILSGKFEKNTEKLTNTNKKIRSAYSFFMNKLTKDFKGKNSDILEFIELILSEFVVISVTMDTLERAHRIYETLNYRGKNLSPSNLVKNHILEKSNEKNFRDNYINWNKIERELNNNPTTEFLKHYWNARYATEKSIATNLNLYDKLKIKIDENNVEEFLSDLIEYSKIFVQLKTPEKTYWYGDEKILSNLTELNYLINDSAQPILLNVKKIWNDKKKFEQISNVCAKIHFKAKTIGKIHANELIKKMVDIAIDIREDEKYDVDDVIMQLQSLDSNDDKFKSDFRSHSYNGKLAKYVLKKIEASKSKTAVKFSDKAHLEHIMPQAWNNEWFDNFKKTLSDKLKKESENKNLESTESSIDFKAINPNNLKDMNQISSTEQNSMDFDQLSDRFVEIEYKKYISKIGNMTLLHKNINSQLQNSNFHIKQPIYAEQDDIKITYDLADEKKWTAWGIKEIDSRTNDFVNCAVEIWSLNYVSEKSKT